MKIIKNKVLTLLLAVMLFFLFIATAYADIGDNIGGGSGGGAGGATDPRYSYTTSLPQGYRVSLITNNGEKIKTIDVTNDVGFAKQVKRHFNKTSKLDYLDGMGLVSLQSPYTYSEPTGDIPQLPNFFNFDIQAVKGWFTNPKNLDWLCNKLNFSFEELTASAKYKLLVEPLVYIKIPVNEADSGSIHAMTATEGVLASIKDRQIAYNLPAILRRQLPISMFLEFDDTDVGVLAYTGKTDWGQNEYIQNDVSKSELGVGIIYFGNEPGAELPPPNPDEPDGGGGSGYAYDFIADSLSIHTTPIREENDFDTSASYTYQQKIDCKYCTTSCDLCGLSGEYQKLIQNGYWSHSGSCDIHTGGSCSCGRYWIPPVYRTTLCHLCYVNCTRCDDGELWYKTELEREYDAPRKSTQIEIYVDKASLDYTKGISGVVKYTKTMTFTADEPVGINTILNAGERIGGKTVRSRINWSGKDSEFNSSNNEITKSINVIPATDLTIEFVEPNAYYRTGTEIVTSYIVHNEDNIGALNVRPKHDLTTDFKAVNPDTGVVVDTSQMRPIVIPKRGTNIVYFKWYLPEDYSADTIKLICELNKSQSVKEMDYSNNSSTKLIGVDKAIIADTPDTVFENKPSYFSKPSAGKSTPTSKLAANVVTSASYERWEWSSDYVKNKYNIALGADYTMTPDEKSPSRKLKSGKEWMMRSGYGVDMTIVPKITSNLPRDAMTEVQRGNMYYPEFDYKYGKKAHSSLERTTDSLQLYENQHTITDKGKQDFLRIHFVPLWYPDGEYRVKTYTFDLWSPVGMLSRVQDIATIEISGDMYDDWYIAHGEQRED